MFTTSRMYGSGANISEIWSLSAPIVNTAVHSLEKERGERLARVTNDFIRAKWLELLSRPKKTGPWSKKEQRKWVREHPLDLKHGRRCACQQRHAQARKREGGRLSPFRGQMPSLVSGGRHRDGGLKCAPVPRFTASSTAPSHIG